MRGEGVCLCIQQAVLAIGMYPVTPPAESVFQEMAAKFRNEREQRMGRKEGRGQGATPAAPAATGAPDEHDFWRLLQARGGAQ